MIKNAEQLFLRLQSLQDRFEILKSQDAGVGKMRAEINGLLAEVRQSKPSREIVIRKVIIDAPEVAGELNALREALFSKGYRVM